MDMIESAMLAMLLGLVVTAWMVWRSSSDRRDAGLLATLAAVWGVATAADLGW